MYCRVYGFGDPPDEYSCARLEIMDVVTQAKRTLTEAAPDTYYDGDPAWSPDGALIAFERVQQVCKIDPNTGEMVCPPRGLFVIASSGGRARRLTRVRAKNPSWSPDGKYIAFDDGRRIGIVGRRGGRVRFIARGTDPAWSPAGDVIAFSRNGDVWLMQPSGARPRLAFRNADEPAWRGR